MNENSYKQVGSLHQDGRRARLWSKSLKSSFPDPIDLWPENLVCSMGYSSTTIIIQFVFLD